MDGVGSDGRVVFGGRKGATAGGQPRLSIFGKLFSAMEKKQWNFVAVLRIEKAGRGGKTVTVIDGLPKTEPFLKEWTKALKNRCGSGGTYSLEGREGLIEIQGDKRELIRAYFESQGVKTKG